MADYTKALRELQLSYIFNANMASVDLSEEDGYSVFKMDNTSFSFQFADDLEDDPDALAREQLLRSQKHLQQVKRRYEHALRRLRQKGYCTEKSLPDLLDSVFEHGGPTPIASTVWVCVVKTLESHDLDIEISDDMWFRAMDRLLVLTNRRLLSDKDTSIVSYFEDHILELYVLLDDSIAQSVAQFTREEAMKTLRREDDLFTRADVKKMARAALEDFVASHADEFISAKHQLKSANTENARLSETIDALKREKRQLEKECYALRKENGALTEDLSHLRSMPSLDVPPAPAEDPVSDDFDLEFEDIDIPDTEELPDLPRSGVMFVGGHPNFIKKLKDLYPGWAYIGSENAPERLKQYSKLEMCFIYTGHISHPVYWGVLNAAKSSGAPYSFVKGTNLDRVITEMRQDYAIALQEKQSDQTNRLC